MGILPRSLQHPFGLVKGRDQRLAGCVERPPPVGNEPEEFREVKGATIMKSKYIIFLKTNVKPLSIFLSKDSPIGPFVIRFCPEF
jgi:hypothetical protein